MTNKDRMIPKMEFINLPTTRGDVSAKLIWLIQTNVSHPLDGAEAGCSYFLSKFQHQGSS